MSKKIKVLYLTTTSKLSGAEKQLYELAKRIDKKKYEVMVCTIMDDLKGHLLDRLKKEGIKTDCLNLDKKWKLWKAIKLLEIIKNFKPDVLQSFLFFDNILARVFGKLVRLRAPRAQAGAPIIISGERSAEINFPKIRNFLNRITIKFTNYIIANSEAGKKVVIKRDGFPEEKIKVIYNGIETPGQLSKTTFEERQVSCGAEDQQSTIGGKELSVASGGSLVKIVFVGRLGPEKGLNYLIEATAILKNKINDFVVYIIGEGPELKSLQQITDKLQLKNKVNFLGRKENAWEYIRNFDLLVLPSLWEGMSNVAMEAMAQNVLVVTTKVGGMPELIKNGETGFLIKPGNSKVLAEKIEYVLNLSEEERKKIGKNAWDIMKEKFSIERMVSEYEKLYIRLINN